MAEKDLRKLSKVELLELLIARGRENIALLRRAEKAEAKLEERRLKIAECGSIAEAALKLNGMFEAAQKAIDLYRKTVNASAQKCLRRREEKRMRMLLRMERRTSENERQHAVC